MTAGARTRKTLQAMPAAVSPAGPPRFRLVHATGSVLLAHGVVLIGRDADCHIPVDDPLASRHHARVTTDRRGTTVVDLGSVNGTWINGEAIDAPRLVAAGDKLVVGGQEMQFVDARTSGTRAASPVPEAPAGRESVAPSSPRPASDRGLRPLNPLTGTFPPSSAPPQISASISPRAPETTGRVDAFELLGALADKALAQGQNARAAELVGPYLRNIVAAAREGRPVSSDTSAFVARYAVKLGAAVGDASWVDPAIELFTILKTPLPAPVIDELYALRLRLPVNRAVLRRYVEVLRASLVRLDAGERVLVQRIAGLDQLSTVDRR